LSTENELWWGFNPEHGWVILDRFIKCNQPGAIGDLLFLRCSDEFVYLEKRDRWDTPHYIYAPQYIASLPISARVSSEERLGTFKLKWPEYRDKLSTAGKLWAQRNLQVARDRFFKKLTRTDPGLRPAENRVHRLTHCYECHHKLDSAIAFECNECGWLVCACGACGCGYFTH